MTVNEISVEAGRNGLEVTGKTSEITGSWFLWLAPNTEKRALSTVTEEAGHRSGKAKKSADSEEDPDVQEAIRRSKLEQPPVPSPRASKRTR